MVSLYTSASIDSTFVIYFQGKELNYDTFAYDTVADGSDNEISYFQKGFLLASLISIFKIQIYC